MSQRNRIVCGAIIVLVSFVMAVPAPAAAGPPQSGLSQAGAWEQAWSWFASAVFTENLGPRVLASRCEKEGGAIDPNGHKSLIPTLHPHSPFDPRPHGGNQ